MSAAHLPDHFAATVTRLGVTAGGGPLGLAISGGGDSMALLGLAMGWAEGTGAKLRAVTVHHHLRPEAAAEAALVAQACAARDIPHTVLDWHWDGHGNLQEAARAARLRLIGAWRGDIASVMMAHTQDDQAETVLMRLARGSGVDGLAAIPERRWIATPGDPEGRTGWTLLRPLLDVSRADLRRYLAMTGLPYAEDPSNDDLQFDRVRARRVLHKVSGLGLDAARLARTAAHMARAREALAARARTCAQEILTEPLPGVIRLDVAALAAIERETQLRILAQCLACLSGHVYRPRLDPLAALLDAVLGGTGGTLHGVRALPGRDAVWITREFAAVRQDRLPMQAGAVWDGRWHVTHPIDGAEIAALGMAGQAQIDRPAGLPAAALESFPAVWQGGTLRSVPALMETNGPVLAYSTQNRVHCRPFVH